MRFSKLVKLGLGWMIGVVGYGFIKSLWQNEPMDWGSIFVVGIAGFIGIFIGFGLQKLFKK